MNTLLNSANMMKNGLVYAGLLTDPNSPATMPGESQAAPRTFVNTLDNSYAITLLQLAAASGTLPVRSLGIGTPGQVIEQWKFVDKEEESWLELGARSRKRFVSENEL